MAEYTFPNQRMVNIHREKIESDFLGIKNENWMAASRILGATAFRLYIYLAANADNYCLALSPAAIAQEIGMAKSTYHDQFKKLESLGYLVKSHGNTYDFYEVPQGAPQTSKKSAPLGQNFDECTPRENEQTKTKETVLGLDREINNNHSPNTDSINIGRMNYPRADEAYPTNWNSFTDNPAEIIYPNEYYDNKPRPEVKKADFVF